MKIGIMVGTRPEIIKMSPIIKYCEQNDLAFDIIHTQQHYSTNMDRLFFDNLEINYPKLSLNIKSKAAHLQIGEITSKCGDIFLDNEYDFILVQGDTNTVLGASLAAQKCGVKLGHVEAGLRSFDREMPEEINRIVTDHLSDFCFCPTETSADNIKLEGIDDNRIFVVGNTIVDAIKIYIDKIRNTDIRNKLDLNGRYALVTLHRPSNVDNSGLLQEIFETLNILKTNYKYKIVFPVHPRTRNVIISNRIETGDVFLCDPIGYFDFLALINDSSMIFTDSGGIQEEACILQKPCITLRENTERPETIDVGANILTGLKRERIMDAVDMWQKKSIGWENPFGDGETSRKIIEILTK